MTTLLDGVPEDPVNAPAAAGRPLESSGSLAARVRSRLGARAQGRRTAGFVLGALLGLQLLGVALIASSHRPWFSFDESNTIRIALLPWGEIDEVLSHDQNFPLYYKLLHVLFLACGPSRLAAIALNFSIWLFTVYLFSRIAADLLGRGPWRLYATLLFALTPSLFMYSYYVRMYGLASFCVLGALHSLTRYASSGRTAWLVAEGAFLCLACAVHPTGGIIAGLFLVAGLHAARSWKDAAVCAAFSAGSLGIAAFELFQKTDFHRIYLKSGIEYITVSSTPFHELVERLLTKATSDYGWMLFAASAVLLWEFFRRGRVLGRERFVLGLFNGTFAVLHVALKSFVDSHHFYFLTGPFLLALAMGTHSLTSGGTRRRAWLLVLPCLLGWETYTFATNAVRTERRFDALSAAIRKLDRGAVLVDFILYNTVARSLEPGAQQVVMFREHDVVDATRMPTKDMLILQAELGGMATTGVFSGTFLAKLRASLSDEERPIDRELERLLGDAKNVYYVLPLNRESLHPEELRLLARYRFKEVVKPSIFRFTRDN